MDYALFSMKGKGIAEDEADDIIDSFISDMRVWQDKYHDLGARDTMSREAFAVNVAKCLGLKLFGDEDNGSYNMLTKVV